MSKINDGGPFYPINVNSAEKPGASVRTVLAGMIMASYRQKHSVEPPSKVAQWSVQDADALITELEKEKE
jgi:hypothetical protein